MLKKISLYTLGIVVAFAATLFVFQAIGLLVEKLVYIYH